MDVIHVVIACSGVAVQCSVGVYSIGVFEWGPLCVFVSESLGISCVSVSWGAEQEKVAPTLASSGGRA